MNFIFPQNYNFKTKFLGVLDYTSAIFCIVWSILVFFISKSIFNSVQVIISCCIIFILPIIIFCFVGFNGENIGTVIRYMFLYFIRPKIYVFSKKY